MEHANDGKVRPHIAPLRFYVGILVALLVLTGLTVGVSMVHLGALNLTIAVLIATVKAALVVLYFMHLRWDHTFHALVFLSAVAFAGIFLAYTVNDTGYRGRLDPESGVRYSPRAGEWAPGGRGAEGQPVFPSR